MTVQTISLTEYKDATLAKDDYVAKKEHIAELRSNVQTLVSNEDTHYASRGTDVHGVVTADASGFAPSSLITDLANLEKEINALSNSVNKGMFPIYGIAIWNGEEKDLPDDWVVCDGTHGTPDMRDRFAITACTEGTYKVGARGGSASVNISTAMRNHTHNFENIAHTCWSDTGNGPYHRYKTNVWADRADNDWNNQPYATWDATDYAGSASSWGAVANISIMNPYKSKHYIMRVKSSDQELVVPKKFTITVTQPTNGKITVVPPVTGPVEDGTRLSISIAATTPGYVINSLYVGGKEVSANYTLYVHADTTISGTISGIPYQVRTFTNAGVTYFTVPAGVTVMYVTAVGGGGGGAGSSSTGITSESSSGEGSGGEGS